MNILRCSPSDDHFLQNSKFSLHSVYANSPKYLEPFRTVPKKRERTSQVRAMYSFSRFRFGGSISFKRVREVRFRSFILSFFTREVRSRFFWYRVGPLNYDDAFVVHVILGSRRHRSRSHIYRV